MLKKFFILIIFIIIVLGIINNSCCNDETHRGTYPVNPYCEKCHGKDGIVQHECTNPNGTDKYCRECGKSVINPLKNINIINLK